MNQMGMVGNPAMGNQMGMNMNPMMQAQMGGNMYGMNAQNQMNMRMQQGQGQWK